MALKMLLVALVASLLAMNPANAALINVDNLCNETITACAESKGDPLRSYVLSAGGGFQQHKVDDRGRVWGCPGSGSAEDCESARYQADFAEFDINVRRLDSYRINNMYAYNLPLTIISQESLCISISCAIPDLRSFCKEPNRLTGSPNDGCENVDGYSGSYGTIRFKEACPDAMASYSDATGFECRTGSNYGVTAPEMLLELRFCKWSPQLPLEISRLSNSLIE